MSVEVRAPRLATHAGIGHGRLSRLRRWVGAVLGATVIVGCGGADAPSSRGLVSAEAPTEKANTGSTGDVYRFAKLSNGSYFYTGNAGERDLIIAGYPDFRYEGVAFQQYLGAGGTPVYRFANLNTGTYFYTANAAERDLVRGTRPDMRYEGTTFSVALPTSPAAQAVYRLANLTNGAYLYTSSTDERDYALSLGIWRNENIAFYTPSRDGYLSCPENSLFSNGSCVCTIAGQEYDGSANSCRFPPQLDLSMRMTSGWAGDYIDGGTGGGDGGGGSGSGGADGGGSAGAGSSLGILKRARVEVWHPKDGQMFLAATGETDTVKGMVTITLGSYNGPALVVFKGQAGATYYDEALKAEVPFPAGLEMNVMVPILSRNFAASPFTEAAYRYALQTYTDPRMSRDANLVRLLTPQRIQVAHDLVRTQINAMLPPSVAVTDITRLPYIVGPTTAPGAVPNTPNGRYAITLSSLAYAAKLYNAALVSARVANVSVTTSPAASLMEQFARDLTDGRLNTFVDNQPVTDPTLRLYSLSTVELTAFSITSNNTLPAMLAEGVRQSVTAYASPALAQAIGNVTTPPPPPPPAPPVVPPSCTGTQYPLPGGGTGCCPQGYSVFYSGSYFYCTAPDIGLGRSRPILQ